MQVGGFLHAMRHCGGTGEKHKGTSKLMVRFFFLNWVVDTQMFIVFYFFILYIYVHLLCIYSIFILKYLVIKAWAHVEEKELKGKTKVKDRAGD